MATQKTISELRELVQDIEVAMFTTRRADGSMHSRPMANQAPSAGADFWFVTDRDTAKVDDLEGDPHVNLAYYNPKSREYVSVSGTARTVEDDAKIAELYRPDWRIWFEGEDEVAGTPDDPRIVLIAVTADSASYLKVDKPRPVILFEIVKAKVTGHTPEIGEVRKLGKRDFQRTRR